MAPQMTLTTGLLHELQCKLAELIEATPEEIDPDLSLINLGVDSLILMEAITYLEQRYSVTLRANQVIEELGTLRHLAEHIEAQTSMSWTEGETDMPPVAVTGASPPEVPRAPVVRPSFALHEDEQAANFTSWLPSDSVTPLPEATSRPSDALAEAFSRRLRSSKLHADRYRSTHADPRSVASFRRQVKELVVPLIVSRADGARIWDIDGNEYVDMAMGFGSLLFGHRYEPIQAAVARQLDVGWGVGPVSFLAGPLSEEICGLVGQERAMFVTTGTEAVMLGVRLARFGTGRRRIAYFRGSYHGWWDGVLALPGGELGQAVSAVGGTIGRAEDDMLLLPYGEPEALEIVERHADSLAAVVVEPVQSRRPDCQPVEMLKQLRELCSRHGIVLLFDEMITGFRLGPGGAAGLWGIKPDIVTFGKALGGGLPIGCVAGRSDLLDAMDGGPWRYGDTSYPQLPTTFGAGTFAKHPLAMAAAWATLAEIRRLGPGLYDSLEQSAEALQAPVNELFESRGFPAALTRCGSLFRFMSRQNLDAFFAALIERGCYLWEGRTMFLSYAHAEEDVNTFVEACGGALDTLGYAESTSSPARTLLATDEQQGNELALTPNQRQLAFAYRAGTAAAQGFHNVAVIGFDGPLDIEALDRAIAAVVERHEGFRTTFDLERGVEILHPVSNVRLTVARTEESSDEIIDLLVAEACTKPFDLSSGPLWRFELVVESCSRARMVVACSDLVADGWSISLVLAELATIYDGIVTGEPHRLDPPGRLNELRQWLSSAERRREIDAALDHWEAVLADVDLSAPLPPTSCGEEPSYVKTRAQRVIDPVTLARLKAVARKQGVTQFSLLLAAYGLLIHRVGGRRDFVVGIPTSGRPRPTADVRSVVASLTTPVPIRIEVDEEATVHEVLREVQRAIFDGIDLAAPVDELARRRAQTSGRLGPILPVMFNLDPLREVRPLAGGVTITIGSPERTFGLLPFSVQACPDNEGGLSISFDAAESMYDHEMVEAWADYYLDILAQTLMDPAQRVSSLRLGSHQ